MMRKYLISLFVFFSFTSALYSKEIVLWHAFEGFLEDVFKEIVEDFNHHSGTYKIIPKREGNYTEVVDKGIASFKEKKHPHILQVYEVATLSMMLSKGYFYPVNDLMKKYHKKFDPDVYIDVIRKFYSSPDGKMLSFPWNASTGIMFYNKDMFRKVGLDPNNPPKTWEEVETFGKMIVEKGYKGYTTAWPAAYHLEHVSCWHNLPFATKNNGFDGLDTRFVFNDAIREFHLTKVAEWSKSGIFTYSGRFAGEPEKKFANQEVAILFQGANRLPLIQRQAKFEIGVGYMPYWEKYVKKPFNLNIGGASFWVMNGFSDDEYRGIVQFFEYLSSTEIQAFWHQMTGYLPITDAAYFLTKKKGYYKTHPASEIAVLEVMKRTPTSFSAGMRFGDYVNIRENIIDELEDIFSGKIPAKLGLDKAVKKGNYLLEKFQKENSTEEKAS